VWWGLATHPRVLTEQEAVGAPPLKCHSRAPSAAAGSSAQPAQRQCPVREIAAERLLFDRSDQQKPNPPWVYALKQVSSAPLRHMGGAGGPYWAASSHIGIALHWPCWCTRNAVCCNFRPAGPFDITLRSCSARHGADCKRVSALPARGCQERYTARAGARTSSCWTWRSWDFSSPVREIAAERLLFDRSDQQINRIQRSHISRNRCPAHLSGIWGALEAHIGPFAGYSTYRCCFFGTPALVYPLTNSVGHQTSSMSFATTCDAHKNIHRAETRRCVLGLFCVWTGALIPYPVCWYWPGTQPVAPKHEAAAAAAAAASS
jgi:hypothetical protein